MVGVGPTGRYRIQSLHASDLHLYYLFFLACAAGSFAMLRFGSPMLWKQSTLLVADPSVRQRPRFFSLVQAARVLVALWLADALRQSALLVADPESVRQ